MKRIWKSLHYLFLRIYVKDPSFSPFFCYLSLVCLKECNKNVKTGFENGERTVT